MALNFLSADFQTDTSRVKKKFVRGLNFVFTFPKSSQNLERPIISESSRKFIENFVKVIF